MRLRLLAPRVGVDAEGVLYVKPDAAHSALRDTWLRHRPAPAGSRFPEYEWERPRIFGGGAARLADVASLELIASVEARLQLEVAA